MNKRITVAIPTHNMKNKDFFLRRSLDSLSNQLFKDFDIVISDNSEDDVLKDIVEKEYTDLDISYNKSARKGMAQNTNEAILNSKGDLIKILYLDDFLTHERSLQEISQFFDNGWLVTGCLHSYGEGSGSPHSPSFNANDKDNFIGSPSVLTIENKEPLLFDEEMTWLLDLDYYKRLYKRYGKPTFFHGFNVTIGLGEHQMTNILSDELKLKEVNYLKKKHD